MATASPTPRLARNSLGMDLCISISRIIALKHVAMKHIPLMKSLSINKLSWMKEPERNCDVDIACLKNLGIDQIRYIKLSFVFIGVFANYFSQGCF